MSKQTRRVQVFISERAGQALDAVQQSSAETQTAVIERLLIDAAIELVLEPQLAAILTGSRTDASAGSRKPTSTNFLPPVVNELDTR